MLAIEPYAVRRTAWTVEADYRYPSVNPVAEPAADGRRPVGDGRRPVGETLFQYRIDLPFAVWLGGANGPSTVLFSVCAPTSPTTLRLFWMSAFDPAVYGDGPPDGAGLQAVEDRIWAPDRAIVESQRPPGPSPPRARFTAPPTPSASPTAEPCASWASPATSTAPADDDAARAWHPDVSGHSVTRTPHHGDGPPAGLARVWRPSSVATRRRGSSG